MSLVFVQELTKSFPSPEGTLRVLDVPRFAMEAAEEVVLFGPSGCGKSTFLNLLAGLLPPDRNPATQVRIGGSELTGMSEPQRDRFRARHLGYVFQRFHLLGGYTVLENVLLGMAFGPGPDRSQALELLEELGIADRKDYLPEQLSSGQRQRVAIARALANRPKLVLADEPTGFLDPERALDALELLRGSCRRHGAALLVVSHDRHVVEAFERRVSFEELSKTAVDSK